MSFFTFDNHPYFIYTKITVMGCQNTGGGATGSSGTRPPTVNPWTKGKENLDEQARMLRENPSLAATLRAQATSVQT